MAGFGVARRRNAQGVVIVIQITSVPILLGWPNAHFAGSGSVLNRACKSSPSHYSVAVVCYAYCCTETEGRMIDLLGQTRGRHPSCPKLQSVADPVSRSIWPRFRLAIMAEEGKFDFGWASFSDRFASRDWTPSKAVDGRGVEHAKGSSLAACRPVITVPPTGPLFSMEGRWITG